MISKATRRTILRWTHLVVVIPIAGYIYQNPSDMAQYAGGVRMIFFPILLLTGLWMWRGAIFALIGTALWLSAFKLSGFGAAVLSQVVLFIAMKIWLLVRARRAK